MIDSNPPQDSGLMHTGDLLTDLLIKYGVTHVFGAAGGQTVALVDGIPAPPG